MAEFSNPAAFFRMRLVTPKGLGRTLLFSVFGCLAVSNALAENFAAVPLQQETAIEFATHETGAAIMGTQDQFVQCMTPIDRQLRLASNQPVEVADYLKFVSEQVLEWRAEEVQKVSQAIESLQPRFAQLRPLWPAKVVLIKTTGREENQAPHCRGNAIVLPEKSLRQTRDAMEHLLTHELFHVLSRQSQERQTQLYAILGFQRCQPIQLPESLALRKLTNPDAPDIDCVLQLKHQDMDISVSPLLITKSPSYDSQDNRTVFSELSFQLLQVRATPAGWVADNASNPTLLDPALAPDFHRQIGRNTAYILHPEETLADNFVHMVFRTKGLPDPWIVEKLRIQLDR